jgi:3-methyladenine DNA glycosylase/8-oxoguanine DNA glycosylase
MTMNGAVLSPTAALPYIVPYDWAGLLDFFAPRSVRGVESIGDGEIRRVLCVRDGERESTVALRVFHCASTERIKLEWTMISGPAASAQVLLELAARVLDLDFSPADRNERLLRDPVLAPVLTRFPGIRLPGAWDPFEMGVRAILGQQVSVAAAHTFAGRLAERWGHSVESPWPEVHLAFPAPGQIAAASPVELAGIGIPKLRAETLHAFARWSALPLPDRPDLESLPGVGPWTKNYIGMRASSDPDAFPAGDLGVHKALGIEKLSPARRQRLAEEISQAWRPYRAYATMLLWKSLG